MLYGITPMPPHVRRERRIVWNLMKHLAVSGFKPMFVHDGNGYTAVSTPKEAMELLFNLDDARLYVQKTGKHAISFVFGNDLEIIADWGYTEGDPDGFNKAMEAFDVEMYA